MTQTLQISALERSVSKSNLYSLVSYKRAFDCLSELELIQLDISPMLVNGYRLPFLTNGSNSYSSFCCSPMEVESDRIKVFDSFKADIFFVVPEPASLLAYLGFANSGLCRGILTANASLQNATDIAFIDVLTALPRCSDPILYLRLYDSHLSLMVYTSIARQVRRILGIESHDVELVYEFRPYCCDLSTRFSHLRTRSVFISDQYIVEESGGEGYNRGISRTYRNPLAPDPRNILLLGDSHSYSALAQIFSFYFQKVRFIWSTRIDDAGLASENVTRSAAQADIVIEEIAERFFLKNYCRLAYE